MLIEASHLLVEEDQGNQVQISGEILNDLQSQYVDLKFYLKNEYDPMHLNYKTNHSLRLKSNEYELFNDILFRNNYDSVLLRAWKNLKLRRSCRLYMMGQLEDI